MTTRLNDTPNSRKLTADEELPKLEKVYIHRHRPGKKINRPKYCPVVEFIPGVKNPDYYQKPIKPS